MGLGWLVSEVLVDLDGLLQWPANNKAIYHIRLVMAYHAIVTRGVQQSVPRWKMVFEIFSQFRSTLLAVLQGRGNTPADEMSVGQRRHQKKRSHQIADVNPFQRRSHRSQRILSVSLKIGTGLETIEAHTPNTLYMVLLSLIFVSNLTVEWSATGSLNKTIPLTARFGRGCLLLPSGGRPFEFLNARLTRLFFRSRK